MRLFKAIKAYGLKSITFSRAIFSKKTLNNIADQFKNPDQSDELKAFSAAFGIFMGILPIWGLQTIAAIFLAMLFKLNRALVIVFSQISFPPLLPLVFLLSYKIGKYWTGNPVSGNKLKLPSSFHSINTHLEQYIYGSITLAIAAAVTTGLLTFFMLKFLKAIKHYKIQTSLKKAV